MAIPSVCTSCGFKQPLELGLQDARARQAMAACLKIAPGLSDRIIRYLEFFSPGDRAIRMDFLARLLEELANDIQAAQIEREGRVWPVPMPIWKEALDRMLTKREKLNLPLKTHGYLYDIVVTIALQKQGKKETQEENKKQHAARNGSTQSVGDHISRRGQASKFVDEAKQLTGAKPKC